MHAASNLEKQKTCFVAMPFGGHFDDYYKTIFEPGIEKARLKAVRADMVSGPRPIVDDILKETKSAFVLLADLTTRNPNVMYEVGLAHALNKPVCLVTEKNIREKDGEIPFDLGHLRVIEYDKNRSNWGEILKLDITNSLKAVLRDPDSARPFRSQEHSTSLAQQDRAESMERLTEVDNLLDRPEFAYLKLTLGVNGRILIRYLDAENSRDAERYLRGFGFPDATRNYLLHVSMMTLEYLRSIILSSVPEPAQKKWNPKRRDSI